MSEAIQVGAYQVTVSDNGGLTCSCGRSTPANWCNHILDVVCKNGVTVTGGDVEAASEIIERHIDVTAVLTERLGEAKKDPSRQHEIAQLEYAIAQRINKQADH